MYVWCIYSYIYKNTFKTVGNSVPSDYIRAAQYLTAEQRDTFLFPTLTILEFDAVSVSQKSQDMVAFTTSFYTRETDKHSTILKHFRSFYFLVMISHKKDINFKIREHNASG